MVFATNLINEVRGNKDIIVKARRISILRNKFDMKIKDIAAELSIASSQVCNLLRVTRLPELVIDGYYSQTLSASHLIAISRLETSEEMIEAYEKVLSGSLSVEKTEDLVQEMRRGIVKEGGDIDYEIKKTIKLFFQSLANDSRVIIRQSKIKASIFVRFSGSKKDTTKLLEKLAQTLTPPSL